MTTLHTHKATAKGTDRYRSAPDLVHLPASENKSWVHSPQTGAAKVLPASIFKLLDSCRTFEPLDKHAQTLCRELQYNPLRMEELRQTLSDLADAGLLVSQDNLLEQFAAEPNDEPPPPITSVAIPTRNRPDSLKVGVESYAQCSRDYGRKIEFLIADQSDDDVVRQTNLSLLAQVKARYGCPIYYGGAKEKEDLARRLADYTGHPFDLINFAVSNVEGCPTAYGANRNALLLATVGSLTLQTDDDSVCLTAPSPETSEHHLQLTSQYIALKTRFLSPSEVETLDTGFVSSDIFTKHEELLGKSVAQCIHERTSINLDEAEGSFFTRGHPRRVFVTSLGIAGESAIGTPFWFLFLPANERASLVRSEAAYCYAMMHHQVNRFVTGSTISDGTYCGAMNLGLDNRQCLPPFTPVQRNEDGVFSELVKLGGCGYFGFLPWMILHKRPSRNYSREDLRRYASSMELGHIFALLVENLIDTQHHNDLASNLMAAGNVFEEWGAVPRAEFEEMLKLQLARRAGKLISAMRDNLQTFSRKPGFWADDVDMCISAFEENIASNEYMAASDLRLLFSQEDAVQLLQRLVLRFGKLLKIWPDLRQAAFELKMQGWQPFRRV